LKNLIVISGLVVALATGSSVAQAGPGKGAGDGARGKAPQSKSKGKSKGATKRCAKVRKVGFVVAGTFVRSGDATSVTLMVTRANRHATRSGLVKVGEEFTATSSRIRYVNRTGPGDAQATDKVKVVGKVTQLKRKCSTTGFTPVATIRSVKVKGPEPVASEPGLAPEGEGEAPQAEAGI